MLFATPRAMAGLYSPRDGPALTLERDLEVMTKAEMPFSVLNSRSLSARAPAVLIGIVHGSFMSAAAPEWEVDPRRTFDEFLLRHGAHKRLIVCPFHPAQAGCCQTKLWVRRRNIVIDEMRTSDFFRDRDRLHHFWCTMDVVRVLYRRL